MVVGNVQSVEMCDVVVIGAGPGGYVCAIRAAQLGKDVILIEKRSSLGGVCLNEGCIPSKALIRVAEAFHSLEDCGEFGIELPSKPKLNFSKLQKWKDSVVTKLTKGVAFLEKSWGVRVIQGEAKFAGPNLLEVQTDEGLKSIDFANAVIATGTVPLQLPNIPVDGEFVIGSKEALSLPELPEKLVVIGGGYIGMELGTAYRKFGSQVAVVELLDQLMGGTLEPEIHQLLLRRAKKLGIDLYLSHRAEKVEPGKPGKVWITGPDGKEKVLEADKVLLSIGRRPYTEHLELHKAGLSTDEKGFIPVNDSRQTAVPHIYAIGDITGPPLLAHKAYLEGKVAAEAIAGHPAAFDVKVVPAVMFTDPEIASVGMTEAEAKERGFEVETGFFPWRASGRALSLQYPEGLTKVIYNRADRRILGIHIAGPHASELIAEGALAIELDGFIDDLVHTIHPHPTLSETVMEAGEVALNVCTHLGPSKPRKK